MTRFFCGRNSSAERAVRRETAEQIKQQTIERQPRGMSDAFFCGRNSSAEKAVRRESAELIIRKEK